VGSLPPETYFSASEYEQQALQLVQQLHEKHDTVILCGGSMMYIDALCRESTIFHHNESLRNDIQNLYRKKDSPIRQQLKILDPFFITGRFKKSEACHPCARSLPYGRSAIFFACTNSAKERLSESLKSVYSRSGRVV
jgi:tRNA dimethylallyltransferase